MSKKTSSSKKQVSTTKDPSVLTLVLAIIASGFVTVLLYVLYVIFVDYIESADDVAAAIVVLVFMLGLILGPGIVVALIVWPKLKK